MSVPVSPGPQRSAALPLVGFLAVSAIAFWAFRIGYWSRTFEEPFSDIGDYITVARMIATQFTFGIPPDQMAYYTPATPSAIAVSIWLGGAQFEAVYRVMIQTLAFAAALGLALELGKSTRRPWLGAAFLAIVALSRPSIFWSYKLSTEGLSEALLMATTALALRAIRKGSPVSAFFAGVSAILLGLNRPQYVPAALALPVLMAFCHWLTERLSARSAPPRLLLRVFAAGMAGLVLAWSPWIIRNYRQFDAIVPLSTTGYESFLWDSGAGSIGPVPYTELRLSDGEVLRQFGIRNIQRLAQRYPNEIDRRDFLGRIAAAWLRENIAYYPAMVKQRLWRFIHVNGASGLTRVPREALFTTLPAGVDPALPRKNRLDRILLDKSPTIVWLALAGLALALLRRPAVGLALACLWVTPWLMVALVVTAERAVEPLIPATIWLALYGVVEAARLVWSPLRRRLWPRAQPTAS